jgi:hypothetical protein
LLGTRTVGWYDTRTQRWHIDRPFRLVVDEHALNTAVTMALPSAQGREPGGQPARGTAAQAQIEPRQPNP